MNWYPYNGAPYNSGPIFHGGTTVVSTTSSTVLASPAPTVNSFSVVGSLATELPPGLLGRNVNWASGANVGYSGKVIGASVNQVVINVEVFPPMSFAPTAGDLVNINP